jgi:hypothetical protein
MELPFLFARGGMPLNDATVCNREGNPAAAAVVDPLTLTDRGSGLLLALLDSIAVVLTERLARLDTASPPDVTTVPAASMTGRMAPGSLRAHSTCRVSH